MKPQQPDDPLAQLEKWGRSVERRISWRYRLSRIRFRVSFRRPARRPRPRHRVRRRAVTLTVVLVLAAVLVASNVWWVLSRPGPDDYAKAPAPGGIGATSGTGAPVRGPFDGTPAATFPSGEDGLVMPAAQVVGAWSEQEVAQALAKVKAALVASHLDHRMIVDHDPSAFLALLAPSNGDDIGQDIRDGGRVTTAVRIAKDATLSGETPRVSGRTTYREGAWDGIAVLEVITNYVWVYPFQVPQTWTGDRVAVVHSEEHWYFPKDKAVAAGNRGMNLYDTDGYLSHIDCALASAGFTAPGRGGADPSARPEAQQSEAPEAYFQPDHTLDIGDGCI